MNNQWEKQQIQHIVITNLCQKQKMLEPCLCQISYLSFLSDPNECLVLSGTHYNFKKKEKRSLKSSKTQTNSCRSSFIKESAPKINAKSAQSIQHRIQRQNIQTPYQSKRFTYPSLKIVKSENKMQAPDSCILIKQQSYLVSQNITQKNFKEQYHTQIIQAQEIKLKTLTVQGIHLGNNIANDLMELSEIPEEKSSFNSNQQVSQFSFAPKWPHPKTVISLNSSQYSECDSVVIDFPLKLSNFNKLL